MMRLPLWRCQQRQPHHVASLGLFVGSHQVDTTSLHVQCRVDLFARGTPLSQLLRK
jgi:hypothetical protein